MLSIRCVAEASHEIIPSSPYSLKGEKIMLLKRFFAVLLCFAFIFSLSSCLPLQNSDDTGEQSSDSSSESSSFRENSENEYDELEHDRVSGMQEVLFGPAQSDYLFAFPVPQEWSITGTKTDGYSFVRDGKTVGTVTLFGLLPASYTVLESGTERYEDIFLEWFFYADPAESLPEEKYTYLFLYTHLTDEDVQTLAFTVKYTALTDDVLESYKRAPFIVDKLDELYGGVLRLDPASPRRRILILGNSFLGTSEIGLFLRDMCDASPETRDYIIETGGHVSVSSSWSTYVPLIRQGEYAAVFMCGFYSDVDVTAFQDYVDACDFSNTPLAIFPAHNEECGAKAAEKYPDVVYLNWKGEINALIKTGVAWSDFCINDRHKHSTPLAGYVGAHMIYRALFEEIPEYRQRYGSLSYEEIELKLGSYTTTGAVPVIHDSKIRYLE